ncbi:MAG: dehydratase [Actinobacteria bacterium]|uniref:Unannotated protein n=1 Tax=freshwater metagenome TaxID=449393 RepID=A0A6J7BVY3_9ZZZZ|nr:dehydratase [Actinomycetota bacterium]MSX38427.1 dehydratase [Actinomycetota bacterium]
MTPEAVARTGMYFEEFSVGDEFTTQGRTITDVEVTMWAMFTGDMHPMHVDNEFARDFGIFGGRFPPGLMAVAIASGLNERMGLWSGTGLAMTKQTAEYKTPVLIGDTISVRLTVLECTPRPKRHAGIVLFGYQIVRQNGDVCVQGEWTIVLASRSELDGA